MESHEDPNAPRWINILLKGEQCQSDELNPAGDKAAEDEDDYLKLIRAKNLTAIKVPPLRFIYKNLDKIAKVLEQLDKGGKHSNGLMLTSPRAVEVVLRAVMTTDAGLALLAKINPHLVFVVGPKTGQECIEKLGLHFNLESASTGNAQSLMEFVKRVCHGYVGPVILYPVSEQSDVSLMMHRGKTNRYLLHRIEAYSTESISNLHEMCIKSLEKLKIPGDQRKTIFNLIFFSPSGVQGFVKEDIGLFESRLRDIYNECVNIELKYSSIGETTGHALRDERLSTFCVSPLPNPTSLSEALLTNISKYQLTA